MKGRPALLLWGFLACQFLSLTRITWIEWFGSWFASVGATANAMSLCFAAAAAVVYLRVEHTLLSRFGRKWVVASGYWVFVMLITGLARGWMLDEVGKDFGAWIILLSFLVAGTTDLFWKDFLGAAPVVLGAGLLVCLASLREVSQMMELALEGERIARDLTAYRLVWVLYLFPPLMVLAHAERPVEYFSAAAAATLVFGLQILFQKRLDTVFVFMVLGLVGLRLLLAMRSGELAEGEGPVRVLGATCFIAIAAAFLSGIWFPGVLGAQTQALVGRYASLEAGFGQSVEQRQHLALADEGPESEGAGERWWIVSRSLSDFTLPDWVFGRGFGGAVVFHHPTIDSYKKRSDYATLIAPYIIAETGKIGRRQVEVGIVMPLIKGGIPAQVLVMSAILYALLRKGSDDRLSKGCKLLLGLYALRYLFGGAFILSDGLQFAAFSAVLGRCMRGGGKPGAIVRNHCDHSILI